MKKLSSDDVKRFALKKVPIFVGIASLDRFKEILRRNVLNIFSQGQNQ